jgi:hypothetical protein
MTDFGKGAHSPKQAAALRENFPTQFEFFIAPSMS